MNEKLDKINQMIEGLQKDIDDIESKCLVMSDDIQEKFNKTSNEITSFFEENKKENHEIAEEKLKILIEKNDKLTVIFFSFSLAFDDNTGHVKIPEHFEKVIRRGLVRMKLEDAKENKEDLKDLDPLKFSKAVSYIIKKGISPNNQETNHMKNKFKEGKSGDE